MKAGDLRPCALCGEGLMKAGVPLFWTVTLQRMGLDLGAVRQVAGLEMMMGNVQLARLMGPDPDVATPFGEGRTILVCEQCAAESTSVYQLGLPE